MAEKKELLCIVSYVVYIHTIVDLLKLFKSPQI